MQNLADRVAWITGAGSGIGLALAHRLAAEKMKLVLVDVEEAALAAADAALRAGGATTLPLRVDVGNGDEMAVAAKRAQGTFGTVHLICSNAGVGGGGGPMWQLSESDWRWTLDVNLWGVLHAIRLLLPPLLASGEEGHLLHTASIAGLTATPFMGPYTASKHAVVALSECLAKELELAKAKVGVSVLCPGFVKTKLASSHRNRAREADASVVTPEMQTFGAVLHQLVDSGVSAESVVEEVVRAIREPRFYVLTHPHMKPAIEHRMKQILDGEQPGIDPMFRAIFSKTDVPDR